MKEKLNSKHPWEERPWAELTDYQKTKLLLESTRQLDIEEILRDFKSLECGDKNELILGKT